jgi:hypothetical protein
VDSSTGDSVAGAGLAVYDSEGNLVESWISDGSEHLIRNLVPGTYTLEEESAPKGYKKAESITFDIDYSFVKKTVTMEDDVITGGVHITKTDSVNPDRTLQGVTFMLFKKSDSIMDTSIDRVYQSAWDEPSDDINAFKQDESDLYIGTYVTDENGEISVENLTYGSYYFAETQTLDNYDLLGDKLEFDIDEENVIKEFTVSNTAHEGWIIYGNTVITVPDKSISERTETREPGTPSTTETPSTPVTPDTPHTSVKTGDETAVLWLMVLMTVAFGMIVILVRRRKKTSELLVISGMLILVGAGVCSGGKNILTVSAKETDTVKVGKSVDTGYCDSEPEHDEYIMDTYTDENTGKEYEVKLCFVKSECVESGYSVPVELTGTIGDYNAEYLVYKGKRYDNPGENLYQIEDLIIDFITESGYPQDSYRNLSYEYDGAEYVGTDGVSYRNFKVNFDAYGSRYTFYYKGSLEIPSENTTTDSSKAVDKTPEETTGGNTADNIAVNSVAADIGTSNLDSTPDRHGTVKSGQTTSSEAIKEASGEAPTAGASDDKAGLTVKKSENRIDAATETDTQDVTEEGTGQAAEETTEGDAEEDTKQDKTSVQSSGSDNGNSDGGTGGGGKDELKQDNLVNKIMCAVLVVVIMGAATTYVVIRRRRPSVQ